MDIPPPVAAASASRHVRLRKVHPISCGKVCAGLYGLGSLLLVPFLLIGIMVSLAAGGQTHVPAQQQVFGPLVMMVFCFALPFIYGLMGFVFGAIAALIYNVIARFVGGLEFEVE